MRNDKRRVTVDDFHVELKRCFFLFFFLNSTKKLFFLVAFWECVEIGADRVPRKIHWLPLDDVFIRRRHAAKFAYFCISSSLEPFFFFSMAPMIDRWKSSESARWLWLDARKNKKKTRRDSLILFRLFCFHPQSSSTRNTQRRANPPRTIIVENEKKNIYLYLSNPSMEFPFLISRRMRKKKKRENGRIRTINRRSISFGWVARESDSAILGRPRTRMDPTFDRSDVCVCVCVFVFFSFYQRFGFSSVQSCSSSSVTKRRSVPAKWASIHLSIRSLSSGLKWFFQSPVLPFFFQYVPTTTTTTKRTEIGRWVDVATGSQHPWLDQNSDSQT